MNLRDRAVAQARWGRADLLRGLLKERFGVEAPGDDIAINRHGEACAVAEGIEWAATAFDGIAVLAPVIRCARCGSDSMFRQDVRDVRDLGQALAIVYVCDRCVAPKEDRNARRRHRGRRRLAGE